MTSRERRRAPSAADRNPVTVRSVHLVAMFPRRRRRRELHCGVGLTTLVGLILTVVAMSGIAATRLAIADGFRISPRSACFCIWVEATPRQEDIDFCLSWARRGLANSETFGYDRGQWMPNSAAIQMSIVAHLSRAPQAAFAALLLGGRHPAARLHGLVGLRSSGRKELDGPWADALMRLASDETEVYVNRGCVHEMMAVRELVQDIEDATWPGGWLGRWCAHR